MIRTQTIRPLQISSKEANSEKVQNSYKVLKILGQGAYGKVFWIVDRYCDNYALKKIKVNCKDNGMNMHCLREVSILQELNHPNVIKLIKWNYSWKGFFSYWL
jgi:cyclin-dependent kinase 3